MPRLGQDLKRALRQELAAGMRRAGYSDVGVGELQRELLWWVSARVGAARAGRQLLRGSAVAWGSNGFAELVPTEVSKAGRGQVTVLVDVSAISPGTERAQYLRLPNAPLGMMQRPAAYSAAGVVARVGADVDGLAAGDPVAVAGAPHASVVTVPAEGVYPAPVGVPVEALALIDLGIIASHGVALSGIRPGQPFCVIGAGLVGALALRLGASAGGEPLAVVARSRGREAAARAGGARSFLVAGRDDEDISALGVPTVIESTGDPEGLAVAVSAAGEGGRIVLLGSPRGTTGEVPVEAMRTRQLQVVGAHVGTIGDGQQQRVAGRRREHGEAFLATLADGGVAVSDLTGPAVDPREAGIFYRRLASDRDLVGAHFDWTTLPPADRMATGHLLRLPNLAVRGVEPERRPVRASGRARRTLLGDDRLAGATGNMRIGILGCGDIAALNGAAIVTAPNTELVACYDPVPRLADNLARSFGGRTSSSVEELVGRDDLDAVLISVPHHLHEPLAGQAIAAGRHVIVEKPLANTLASAEQMVEAAEKAGVVFSVCFPQRYATEVIEARRLVDQGALGRFCGSAVSLYLDKSPYYWEGGYSGRSRSDWRSSRGRAGGGVLIMNLSHHIDLIRHLTGAEVETVSAVAGVADEAREVEDAISVGVTFTGGAVGSFTGYAALRGSDSSEVRIWGRDGQVVLEPAARAYTLRAVDGMRTGRWQALARGSGGDRAVYLSRLATALDQGRPVDVPARDGLAVQSVIEAAYRSAATGMRARPSDLLDGPRR